MAKLEMVDSATNGGGAQKRYADGTVKRIAEGPGGFSYNAPSDWPLDGPIDLAVHDLPHDSAATEWWYIHGHVKTLEDNPRELSFFAAFFRSADLPTPGEYSHALNWAIIDPAAKKFHSSSFLDRCTPSIVKDQVKGGKHDTMLDHRLRRSLQEILERNEVPLPDKLFPEASKLEVSKTSLDIDFAGNTLQKLPDGSYKLHCEDADEEIAFDLILNPKKEATRQGHNGIVKNTVEDTMFYYFIPRNETIGQMKIGKEVLKVAGTAWYDHEFGGRRSIHQQIAPTPAPKEEKVVHYAWNWIGIQLDNGTDITATLLADADPAKELKTIDEFAVVVKEDSSRQEYLNIELRGSKDWISVRTAKYYPTHWVLNIPEANIALELEAPFPEQELISITAKTAFWEGRMNVTGTVDGVEVKGAAFVERHGFQFLSSMDTFFKTISKAVKNSIDDVLPYEPTHRDTQMLVANEAMAHYMDGLDVDVFGKTMIRPIREIVDRGGKSWRSLMLLSCIDCVGGNSLTYRHWLAMPEVMHVGSLIVDDIQDESEIRRGGKACHLVHGVPIAINCGTAAYFLALDSLLSRTPDMTPELELKMHTLHNLTLRAGHAGQALDINGLDYMMDDVVASGDSTKLVAAVTCTHRLKSAVPAGNLARMGAIIGGGSEVQIEALGKYMEGLGVAFQIIDDVLNLRGFEGNTKDRGEDLRVGKITHPVTVAMGKLDAEKRKWVWESIKSKPNQDVVNMIIEEIESCGALNESEQTAKDLVEESWRALDPLIPDSFYKMIIRAFGWFVLERHY